MPSNRFLIRNKENADLNQYWFSKSTIESLVEEIEEICIEDEGLIGFLSTPSLYFSLKNERIRSISRVFDIDVKWKKDPGFFYYDFNGSSPIPEEIHHAFQMVVIDPPFVTREVWEKYAQTAKLLLKEDGGKVILTTIAENRDMMKELLDVEPQIFQPSIPCLVYQYNLYCNFQSHRFSQVNNEIIQV